MPRRLRAHPARAGVYPPISEHLRALGIELIEVYGASLYPLSSWN